MNVDSFRNVLAANPGVAIQFMLPDGEFVPSHFHITEVGRVHKEFIDCGGTIRSTTSCVLQIWVAEDLAHRLNASKLAAIVRAASPVLKDEDLPVEIEYERDGVVQFPLSAAEVTPSGILFHLGDKHTACLAPDKCGVGALGETGCCEPTISLSNVSHPVRHPG